MSTRFSSRRPQAVSFALLTLLTASAAQAHDVSGTAALTSDYVWRGISQSNERPAVQAGAKLAGDNGLYAQVWASSVEFAPEAQASSEFDLVAGWSGALSDAWALDVNLTHYRYPDTTVDLDWTEANATLTLQDRHWLQIGHSNDALASDAAGTYAQLGTRLPLGDTVRIEAAAGHYRLDTANGDNDYTHWQLDAVWAFAAPFELRVTAHDTDTDAQRVFGPWAGARVEAALQAAF